jgi:large conductance mechanosensitive channel
LRGNLLDLAVAVVIVAAVIFFLVIKPVNHPMKRLGRTPEEDPVRGCPECLSKVPEAATRCAYSTSQLTPTGSGMGD